MIPAPAVTAWSTLAPWVTRAQVEQDLLLSRLIIEIATDPYLGKELVFRGGTCLHKPHLQPARRYSEDLDYVRSTGTGIGRLTRAVTAIGEALGFAVGTRLGVHPKMYLRATAEDGTNLRVKVEVNTYELSPALPLITVPFEVNTSWWSGSAEVPTFSPPELVATKLRALYQRKKGRDLFDLWLALTELGLDPGLIVEAFAPYRPEKMTKGLAVANLRRKIDDEEFREDLPLLVADWPTGYDVKSAADLVIAELHSRL